MSAPPTIRISEPLLDGREAEYLASCVAGNEVSARGGFVPRFEAGVARACGVTHGVAVNSGTSALHVALRALGVGPGDEVVVPSLTMIACGNAVALCGATPVFCDVDPATWNVAAPSLSDAIGPRTRAAILVDLYGRPLDGDALAVCAARGVPVIEDAAEAFGARDAELAGRARRLADMWFVPERRFHHPEIGFSYRLSNLGAALGCAQLERAEELIARRLRNAARYRAALDGIPGLTLPALPAFGSRHVYWMFGVVLDHDRGAARGPSRGIDRDALQAHLQERGIETRPFFLGLHAQPCYDRAPGGRRALPCPVTDRLGERGLLLPSGPSLDEGSIARVADALRSALA